MFKVNNKNTTSNTRHWRDSGGLLLTYFTPFSSVSIVDFKQANFDWQSGSLDFLSTWNAAFNNFKLTVFRQHFSRVSNVHFEQVNVSWVNARQKIAVLSSTKKETARTDIFKEEAYLKPPRTLWWSVFVNVVKS